jgi:hypothetical protein
MVYCVLSTRVRQFLLYHSELFPSAELEPALTDLRHAFYELMAHNVWRKFEEVRNHSNEGLINVSELSA